MQLVNQYINSVAEARKRRLNGLVNSIYWSFERLTDEKMFPGWVKGKYYGVTASTSVNT